MLKVVAPRRCLTGYLQPCLKVLMLLLCTGAGCQHVLGMKEQLNDCVTGGVTMASVSSTYRPSTTPGLKRS